MNSISALSLLNASVAKPISQTFAIATGQPAPKVQDSLAAVTPANLFALQTFYGVLESNESVLNANNQQSADSGAALYQAASDLTNTQQSGKTTFTPVSVPAPPNPSDPAKLGVNLLV